MLLYRLYQSVSCCSVLLSIIFFSIFVVDIITYSRAFYQSILRVFLSHNDFFFIILFSSKLLDAGRIKPLKDMLSFLTASRILKREPFSCYLFTYLFFGLVSFISLFVERIVMGSLSSHPRCMSTGLFGKSTYLTHDQLATEAMNKPSLILLLRYCLTNDNIKKND